MGGGEGAWLCWLFFVIRRMCWAPAPTRISDNPADQLAPVLLTLPMWCHRDPGHYNGVQDYDVHNLYGTGMSQASANALVNVTGKRPFVVTR